MKKLLSGHVSEETAYVVNDYPYGGMRTQMRFWVETRPKFGQRVVTQSLNPKTGRWNKPHAGGYTEIVCLFINEENGHCEFDSLSFWLTEKKANEFELTYGPAFDEHQKEKLKILRALNKSRNTKSYFEFTANKAEKFDSDVAALKAEFTPFFVEKDGKKTLDEPHRSQYRDRWNKLVNEAKTK
jgi:hypothetical protein